LAFFQGVNIYENPTKPFNSSTPTYSFNGATDYINGPQSFVLSSDGQYGLLLKDDDGTNVCDVFLWEDGNIVITSLITDFWYDSALSANGQYQIVANISGSKACYVSNNYGQNWVAATPVGQYFAVAVSANGKYMMAVNQATSIEVSDNFGVSFTPVPLTNFWFNCCMSANGQYMMAIANDNGNPDSLYTSNDFGVTWTNQSLNYIWQCCGMTDSGRFQVAFNTSSGGQISFSTTYGITWTTVAAPTSIFDSGQHLRFTSDGKYIVGLKSGSPVYLEFSTMW
jgi:hypothetical protein